MNQILFSSKTTLWRTPTKVFSPLNAEFNFRLDVCAIDLNARLPKFLSPKEDGLNSEWSNSNWMNPPYGRGVIEHWVEKAFKEHLKGNTTVALLPARTDTRWFHEWVLGNTEIRFIKGRIKFDEPLFNLEGTEVIGYGEGSTNSSTFPSIIVIWRGIQ